MIRPTTPTDIDPLVSLADTTGVFKPHEIEALREVLDDYFAGEREFGHICETYESDDSMFGFAYYAPIPMTDRDWQLYWIAVTKQTQAKGIGGKLLKHVEKTIREKNGRLLLLETSALPYYELTRKFYLKHGYDQEATDPRLLFGWRLDGNVLETAYLAASLATRVASNAAKSRSALNRHNLRLQLAAGDVDLAVLVDEHVHFAAHAEFRQIDARLDARSRCAAARGAPRAFPGCPCWRRCRASSWPMEWPVRWQKYSP